ncbi:MAG: hypothetical protein QOE36_66 [Gaiellaceae bacterium]|nr:hypothetical protein [Gaiellaceae bacterium]
MYGLTRGTITLIGAAAAGLLIWLATQVNDQSTGGYWAAYGLIAAAGLTMAFSQILGGWTKWGWPRISPSVFLIAFLPVLIVGGWIVIAGQPADNWFRSHVISWSGDIHVTGLVTDLLEYVAAIAFGIGLVFGLTFDTTGPRIRRDEPVAEPVAADEPMAAERTAMAEHDGAVAPTTTRDAEYAGTTAGAPPRTVEIRESGTTTAPRPEPPPRQVDEQP